MGIALTRARAADQRVVPSRSLLTAGLVGGALLSPALLASPAAAVQVVGTVRSPDVANASTHEVIYYFDFVAGAQDERFSLVLTPPKFATRGGGDEGESLDGPLQEVFQSGPGTIGQVTTDPSFGALCSSRDQAFHGYSTGAATIDLALPAGAHSRFAVRYATGRRAPWIDTDYTLRFKVQPQVLGTYPAGSPLAGGPTPFVDPQTLFATTPITVAAGTTNATKIGAHLLLKTSPAGVLGDTKPGRKLARGKAVKVSGSVLPAVAGKKVNLQWAKGDGTPRTAVTVKTTKAGRFSATVTPPGKGVYGLWATYPKQTGTLAADTTSCPLTYRVS
ncbi:MAG: hypothetical protein AAGC46_13130 [Solirubrobacteraceae bacterium]|nr:hypothetical protein [Patulibacter sp.]